MSKKQTPSKQKSIAMSVQTSYNVRMKEERIEIRANEEFVEKVDYLKLINDYKSRADTIRKTVEKEYIKEVFPCGCCKCYEDKKCIILDSEVNPRTRDSRCELRYEKEDGKCSH